MSLKKHIAFSLVEILVALIIVSVITAALAPVITKKLSSAGITIVGGGSGGGNTEAQWGEPRSQADCDPYNALYIPKSMNGGAKSVCVTKYNAGDNFGPSIPSTVTTVSTSGATCTSTMCCWKGQTSTPGSCSDNDGGYGSSYSGCTRTVCGGYKAGVEICSNWTPSLSGLQVKTWRMPTKTEAQGWVDNYNALNNKTGSNGLQLCSSQDSRVGVGVVQCDAARGITGHGYCLGGAGENGANSCYPHNMWLADGYELNHFGGAGVQGPFASLKAAETIRCVTDNVPYPETIGSSGGSSGQVDIKTDCSSIDSNCQLCTSSQCITCKQGYTLNDEGKCEIDNSSKEYLYPNQPKDQTDCDPYNALFIPEAITGTGRNICMSKYNPGDNDSGYSASSPKGPTIPGTVTIVDVGTHCDVATKACCWKGKTASNCETSYSNEDYSSSYTGCNRTVCNLLAAEEICAKNTQGGTNEGDWRLPTPQELYNIATQINTTDVINLTSPTYASGHLQRYIGSDGLQLCDSVSGYGSARCNGSTNCTGANTCAVYDIYTNSYNSWQEFGFALAHGAMLGPRNVMANTHPRVFRCVYDPPGILKDFEYDCPTLFDNCESCTKSQCTACKSGYVLEHGLCVAEHPATREPASQEDCNPFNALFIPKEWNGGVSNVCVTKYNVGDPGGPPIANGIKKIVAGNYQNICKIEDQGNCCWQGRTARSCTDTDGHGSSYSGCNRTVCNYEAGEKSCENWEPFVNGFKVSGWRIPTDVEANAWASRINSTTGKDGILKEMGSDGLQACKASINYIENYALCQSADHCNGAFNDDDCYPCDIALKSSSTYYRFKVSNADGIIDVSGSYIGDDKGRYPVASIRCAIDKLPYGFKGSKTTNFSTGFQKSDSYPILGAPQKQADCDPYNAVFIPAKYNGENGVNLCVTRYNVGDHGGPPWETYGGRNSKPVMNFINNECNNSDGNCCWQGITGDPNACIPDSGRYPGCKRTVCGYNNAYHSCYRWNPLGGQNYSWRLPTQIEATGWKNSPEVQEILKSYDGGLFCTSNSSDPFVCKARDVCKGAKSCYPQCYWLRDGDVISHFCWSDTGINIYNNATLSEAMSSRCVSSQVWIK